MSTPIYIGADHAVVLDGLSDSSTDAYINSGATLTFTIYRLMAQDGAMTSGSAVLTSAVGLFAIGDIGRSVVIPRAGANGADLRTTISAFTSATSVTLATAASKSVTKAQVRVSLTSAQDVSMAYVAESSGKYRGTLDDAVAAVLKDQGLYWVEITIDGGSGRKDFRVLETTAQYRE